MRKPVKFQIWAQRSQWKQIKPPPTMSRHQWATILRFLPTIWFLQNLNNPPKTQASLLMAGNWEVLLPPIWPGCTTTISAVEFRWSVHRPKTRFQATLFVFSACVCSTAGCLLVVVGFSGSFCPPNVPPFAPHSPLSIHASTLPRFWRRKHF